LATFSTEDCFLLMMMALPYTEQYHLLRMFACSLLSVTNLLSSFRGPTLTLLLVFFFMYDQNAFGFFLESLASFLS